MPEPDSRSRTIRKAAERIWDIALDSWALNVELREDEAIVYQSAWEKEFVERVERELETLLKTVSMKTNQKEN